MQESENNNIIGTPTVKFISLPKGLWTVVDAEDFERLNQWKWHTLKNKGRNVTYVTRREGSYKGPRKVVMLHRQIVNFAEVDHRDRNGLNNTRQNLRDANDSENCGNRKLPITNTSGYKGVSWKRKQRKWVARIGQRHIGYFFDSVLAARAYDNAAIAYYGEFALTNQLLGLLE